MRHFRSKFWSEVRPTSGYQNKQNYRIWGKEQPEAMQDLLFCAEKTMACGWVKSSFHISSKTDADENVTVNANLYRSSKLRYKS